MRNNCLVFFSLLSLLLASCGGLQVAQKVISAESNLDVTATGISVYAIGLLPNSEESFNAFKTLGEQILYDEIVLTLDLEGFFVRKIDSDGLRIFLNEIGRVEKSERVFHGQIVDWRDIYQRRVVSSGMVVAHEGVPYAIDDGFLSLIARCWELQREDGRFMYVQILPTWHVPRGAGAFIGEGQVPKKSKMFDMLEVEALLKNKEAIVFGTL